MNRLPIDVQQYFKEIEKFLEDVITDQKEQGDHGDITYIRGALNSLVRLKNIEGYIKGQKDESIFSKVKQEKIK